MKKENEQLLISSPISEIRAMDNTQTQAASKRQIVQIDTDDLSKKSYQGNYNIGRDSRL